MKNDSGFTLIELLVVIAITGILAAIAIPQYSAFRIRSYDATAELDLKGAVVAQEALMTENQSYASCVNADDCEVALPGFKPSRTDLGTSVMSAFNFVTKDVDFEINGLVTTVVDGGFTASAKHLSGVQTFEFDSETGAITAS